MKPHEITAKRRMIADLCERQLRAWWRSVFTEKTRDPFPGEEDLLKSRARSLGLNIKDA